MNSSAKNKRVIIGMSGGVDSSVAAHLLLRDGYEVIGAYMHNWEEKGFADNCTDEEDYKDVKEVAACLEIPIYTANFAKEYLDNVFNYFLDEYSKGRTPNPDVLCNREIKFGSFMKYAKALGADYVATGHYCGIKHENNASYLVKAKDSQKDQTYFLSLLSQEQLREVIFPLANLTKNEVRRIAEENNIPTAKKKDSTGICFIGERNFRAFMQNYFPNTSGDIVNTNGKKVGRHIGLMYYTIGQRRGLGLGGDKESQERWFVVEKDLKTNTLVVSHGEESVLNSKALYASNINWIPYPPKEKEFECYAKFRYRQPEQRVKVKIDGNNAFVEFFTQQRAITPGQFAVFYNGEYCLGGGTIDEAFK